jgi:hypothetical protein
LDNEEEKERKKGSGMFNQEQFFVVVLVWTRTKQ